MEYISQRIENGAFPTGETLPSMQEIAKRTGSSLYAVRNAVRALSGRGVLRSVRRRGTIVERRPALGRATVLLARDPHTNVLLQGPLSIALVRAGYEVSSVPYVFGEGAEGRRLLDTRARDADILIALAPGETHEDHAEMVWRFAERFSVRVFYQYEDVYCPVQAVRIQSDWVAAARLVAGHLLGLGHRRIGTLSGSYPGESSASARRSEALRHMVELAGGECFPYYYTLHGHDGDVAFLRSRGCTAWWAVNDHWAVGTLSRLAASGLRVPDDMSVVGMNDTPYCAETQPSLTSLSLDPEGVARAMVEAITGARESCADASRNVVLVPPRLVARESTGPAPAQSGAGTGAG